jgi:hypothetical protein
MLCDEGGLTKRRKLNRRKVSKPGANRVPPSVANVLNKLINKRTTEEQLMFNPTTMFTPENDLLTMHTAFAQSLVACHSNSDRGVGGFVGPVCSVDYDNTQLFWGRPGVPDCSAQGACVALSLTHNQGVLQAFLLPGQDNASGSLCLLCTRVHAQLMNESCTLIDKSGTAPLILPPLTNLVDCPGGYYSWALGVTPQTQRCFSRTCSIVGSPALLTVRYSPLSKRWWVDQEKIMWRPPQPISVDK